MDKPSISTVAVIGTGVIGRSWIRVFIRAGCQTRVFDRDATQVSRALAWIRSDLGMDHSEGLISAEELEARLARLKPCTDVSQALQYAGYVQECGPENLTQKRAIFAELDRMAQHEVILASSTSGLSMTEIAVGLHSASRCVVAHPVNPPHIIPVVEIVPGEKTDSAIVTRVETFLASLGQTPIRLHFDVPGFLLNRLQAALLREAIHLVKVGVADLEDIEAVVSDGVGLRWALMGPFGVAHTNADGGLREDLTRFRTMILGLMNDLGPTPNLSTELIAELSAAMNIMDHGADPALVRRWRDRMVRKIRALKASEPHP